MSDLKVELPIKMSMQVIVTDGDGQFGEVDIDFPPMKMPTIDQVISKINDSDVAKLLERNGLRIANQKETFDYMCIEKAGSAFAMPRNCGEWLLK
ncbi:hypothetical protein VPHK165_0047 [Vibrio phage K165]|nr:hypothetical protein MYOV022v2_p0036 [Vibrio phage 12E28.1]QZI90205.1 hypothetical protein MYOV021v2_p0036 [Vibrio phage 18E29.1]QZI90570.1 hypothetical protein MYOV023v1_p0023 [Vibrio phage 91E28.1a]QZI90680.1 hypothetical protein MYOV020v1_p0054 [Vibrio phage 98E28.6a]